MERLRLSHHQAGWTVLEAVGAIDVATAPQLRQLLMELQHGERRWIALDLDGVEFLDSFGLGVIVGALKRAATRGGEVAVVCSRSRLIQLFEITRLREILRIVGSLAELGDPGPAESA